MKAILEFNLPEDRYDYQLATKAFALSEFQDEFWNKIKRLQKSGELTEEQDKIIEELRTYMGDYAVEIEE